MQKMVGLILFPGILLDFFVLNISCSLFSLWQNVKIRLNLYWAATLKEIESFHLIRLAALQGQGWWTLIILYHLVNFLVNMNHKHLSSS